MFAGTTAGALAWAQAPLSEPILPVPQTHKESASKAALGKKLFNDNRLSRDNAVSCASCHNLPKGGSDLLPLSKGVQGRLGKVNAPTVLNSSMNFRQFWDGRAASLEEQVAGPIHDTNEMDTTWAEVLRKLNQDTAFTTEFKKVYPDGMSAKNIADALASFQRTLITPNARFDKYLRGDKTALTTDELRGYQLFKSYGCVACHQGVNVGGNMYQTFGVMGDYFGKRGNPTPADLGRFNVTKKESDKHSFKVPSLRNVALTAPYFHDGSAKTLGDAVDVMFRYQLGRQASAEDKKLIVKFLHTLSGELDGKPLASSQAVD
ncbi:Cytochrome c551 peroxidase [bioreactor metagenome]|uniref:Cytochrome c551 peroxidase n=1 Tax=bioreactor metagenome TaxID=1076179 RepID=A0A645B140_9ZZZZ